MPPAPTPPAEHKFEGWFVGGTKIDEDYLITGDTIVKAGYVYVTLAEEVESLEGEDVTDPGCTVAGKQGGVTKLDDPFGNVRYVGACPSNYVWYNCSVEPTGDNFDYENNCERWRIIGTFKDISDGAGNTADRIKIMRDNSLGKYSWDTNPSSTLNKTDGQGINQWGETVYENGSTYPGSKLKIELNTDYLDYTKTGTTTWYNGSKNKKEATYSYSNSLSAYAQTLIDNAVWHTATANVADNGTPYGGTLSTLTVKQTYLNERSGKIFNEKEKSGVVFTASWTGKVAVISPSDYGYSTNGGTYGRSNCINSDKWAVSSGTPNYNAQCYQNSWIWYMIPEFNSLWTLNRGFVTGDYKYAVYGIGNRSGTAGQTFAYADYQIHPSVFLGADVRVTGGAGTHANPFTVDHKKVQIKN